MAEYIERTEELMLAMNAGARAIENTKRYHGAVYTKDVFSDNSQEIPYLLAAKVLREVSDAPAADVAPVVYGRSMLCREHFERPWVMKNVAPCVQYQSSVGIVFYMGYDVFRGLVEHGKITPLSPEGEKNIGGHEGFGWHISDLKIYDTPKKLSEFTGLRDTRFGAAPYEINCPPRSWYYVQEME